MNSRTLNAAKPRNILIIKMRYIGDAVLVTPLLGALKQAMPGTRLHLLVNREAAGIVQGHPHLDDLIAFDYDRAKRDIRYAIRFMLTIRRLGCDMVMDLTRNDRSALITFISGAARRIGYEGSGFFQNMAYTHRLPYRFGRIHTVDHHLEMAKALGLPEADVHPYLAVSDQHRQQMRGFLETNGIDDERPLILIHPGARRWYKSWPLERFARIADTLTTRYRVQIALSGAPQDRDACARIASGMQQPVIDLCGKVPLDLLPALIQASTLLIGNDSAPIHIATGVNTPVVALFGPTPSQAWKPRRNHDRTLEIPVDCPCRPCGHSRPDCPLGREGYCMAHITEARVQEAIEEILTPAVSF